MSTDKAFDAEVQGGLGKVGLISITLTIIILMVVLGSLVAALIPLLVGLTSVIATFGLIAFASQGIAASKDINEVILLVGLAVGVDYSLFYMRREREERAAGRGESAALAAAAATSGHAVLVSGFTVLIAMAGMFLSGDATFMSFSVGTMLVVAVAMLGSLTVLPGRALQARRQGRARSDPVPPAQAPRRRREQGPGRDPRPRAAPSGHRHDRAPPPSCSSWPPRRSICTPRRRGWRASAARRWIRSRS